jgi:hypothetical protein
MARAEQFKQMIPEDLDAIVAYLRTFQAIDLTSGDEPNSSPGAKTILYNERLAQLVR